MSRAAISLDFSLIPNFSASEWPASSLAQMSADTILALGEVRNKLPKSHKITPSPLFAAHVRQAGNSRHSTKGGKRLSDATDCFMLTWAHLLDFWVEAQRNEHIGGIGLYVNRWFGDAVKKPITPMFHIDCRPERLLWICRTNPVNGGDEYIYLHANPKLFFEEMQKLAEM